jgi:hypothetical protein
LRHESAFASSLKAMRRKIRELRIRRRTHIRLAVGIRPATPPCVQWPGTWLLCAELVNPLLTRRSARISRAVLSYRDQLSQAARAAAQC